MFVDGECGISRKKQIAWSCQKTWLTRLGRPSAVLRRGKSRSTSLLLEPTSHPPSISTPSSISLGPREPHRASEKFPSSCSEAPFARAPVWPPSPPPRREFQRYVSTSSNHPPTPRLRHATASTPSSYTTPGSTITIGPVATFNGRRPPLVLMGRRLELSHQACC